MYTYQLAQKGKDDGITVHCVRVTNVEVDLDRYPDLSAVSKFLYKFKSAFSISPAEMAKTYTWLAGEIELNDKAGRLYWDSVDKRAMPSAYATDNDQQIKLREFSEEMIQS